MFKRNKTEIKGDWPPVKSPLPPMPQRWPSLKEVGVATSFLDGSQQVYKAPSTQPGTEVTLVDKMEKQYIERVAAMHREEHELEILQRDIAWLKLHPEADRIFQSVLSRMQDQNLKQIP